MDDSRPSFRLNELAGILSEIPLKGWQDICRNEPEWYEMEHIAGKYGFGVFAVIMVLTGLNDFQLKGPAEKAYWPPIRKIFDETPQIESLSHIGLLLERFYQNERYDNLKLKRMNKFLESELARLLWGIDTGKVAAKFPDIWRMLAQTMEQEHHAKTIVFAMKCLGVSLLISGETKFDFSDIPIPVDYRILEYTKKSGICGSDGHFDIQASWDQVLKSIQSHQPGVNMVHLDSLIWQIGVMDENRVLDYFLRIGFRELGEKLTAFMNNSKNTGKKIADVFDKPVGVGHRKMSEKPIFGIKDESDGEVICFIPCCASKNANGQIIGDGRSLTVEDLPATYKFLSDGRAKMRYCIKDNSRLTSALNIYSGSPYQVFNKPGLINLLQAGRFRLMIVSAGYGLLDAFEPIHDYNEMLKGKAASQWRANRLDAVIGEYLWRRKPDRVYGFFAGGTNWNPSSSLYRYFFTRGVLMAAQKGLKAGAGCFYRKDGLGAKAILNALGNTFMDFVNSGFDASFVNDIVSNEKEYGGVTVAYNRLV